MLQNADFYHPRVIARHAALPQHIRLMFAYDPEMTARKLAIQPKDLETPCTQCHYPVPPSEIMRLDFERMRCPRCLAVFIPEQKGQRQQLGS